jgi:hypothetical protein
MEDVIDALRERAIPQSFPLELPDEDMLVVIEEEILLPIPYTVRLFLLMVSDVVYGTLEPITAADPNSHTHLPEVTAQAWADGLPRDLLPICQVGADYYCVDQNGEVKLWIEGKLENDHWENIWRWAEDVWLNS